MSAGDWAAVVLSIVAGIAVARIRRIASEAIPSPPRNERILTRSASAGSV